jgi:hypothetical protein
MLVVLPIRSTGPSKSIALLGISCSGEDEGVSTMVMPPALCIAAKPREPSSNVPDRITPIARGPRVPRPNGKASLWCGCHSGDSDH